MKFLRKSRPDDLLELPTLPVSAAYALWAETYPPEAHNALMAMEQKAMLTLMAAMPSLAGRSVLDLACGTGRYSRIAAQAGAARIVGADSSAAMLGKIVAPHPPTPSPTRREGEKHSVLESLPSLWGRDLGWGERLACIVQASMDALPFAEASFDVLICALATGHLPPEAMRRAMAEMARVLRHGGDALISRM